MLGIQIVFFIAPLIVAAVSLMVLRRIFPAEYMRVGTRRLILGFTVDVIIALVETAISSTTLKQFLDISLLFIPFVILVGATLGAPVLFFLMRVNRFSAWACIALTTLIVALLALLFELSTFEPQLAFTRWGRLLPVLAMWTAGFGVAFCLGAGLFRRR